MKRDKILGYYEFHSSKASDVGRQLAFAGIATIWLFHVGDAGHAALPDGLIAPLIFFSVALALDFLHYVSCALIWGAYHRHRERTKTHAADDKDVDAPPQINWPGLFFFWSKLLSIAIAQFLLIRFIAHQWGITA